MVRSLLFVYDNCMFFMGHERGFRKNAGMEERGKCFECCWRINSELSSSRLLMMFSFWKDIRDISFMWPQWHGGQCFDFDLNFFFSLLCYFFFPVIFRGLCYILHVMFKLCCNYQHFFFFFINVVSHIILSKYLESSLGIDTGQLISIVDILFFLCS